MGERSDDMRLRHEQTLSGHGHTGEPGHVNTTERAFSPDSERDREIEALRSEIERTRLEMSETFSAIQARLSPEHLKAQARERVREATIGRARDMADEAGRKARGMRHTIIEAVREYPLPAALIGLGVSWLLAGIKRNEWEEDSRYVDRSQRKHYRHGEYETTGRGGYTLGQGEYPPEGYYGTHEGTRGRAPEYHGEREHTRHDYGRDVDRAREYGRDKVQGAMDTMKETAGSVQETASRMTGQAREMTEQLTSQAKEKAEHFTSQAREKAEHFTSQARETTGRLAGQARESVDRLSHRAGEMGTVVQERAARAKSGFFEVMEDNPMVVALGIFALGAAVGLSVPETRREQEVMGDLRDDLLERAQEAGRQTLDRVQRVATEVGRAAKEEAERQHLTGEEVLHKAEQVASKAGEAAKKEPGQAEREAGQSGQGQATQTGHQESMEENRQAGGTTQKEPPKSGGGGPAQREAKNQGLVE